MFFDEISYVFVHQWNNHKGNKVEKENSNVEVGDIYTIFYLHSNKYIRLVIVCTLLFGCPL